MSDKTVYVDDQGTGRTVRLRIDNDGDIEVDGPDGLEVWIKPAELVTALRELGVLPPLPEVVWGDAARRIEPSDRVRESWRRHAAEDANGREALNEHISRRKVKNRAAEYRRQAEERRAKFYRDRDGDVWRSLGNGQLIIHKFGPSNGRGNDTGTVEGAEPVRHERVTEQWGPLVAVTDPAISDPYAALRRAADDAAARAAQTAVQLVPRHGAFADSMDSAFIRQLRAAAQRHIAAPSIWRNFS